MNYHKINGLYKRYTEGKNKGKFIIGEYSQPEFELLKDIEWEWTEKIDGTMISVNWDVGMDTQDLEFEGKTNKAEIPKHLLAKLNQRFTKEKMINYFKVEPSTNREYLNVELKGEGYGYKIQSGCKYFGGLKEVDFVLFDIKIMSIWLKREKVIEIAKQLGIPCVPIVGHGTINEAVEFIKRGFKSTFGNFIAEGIVIRPKQELRDRMGRRIITKIKTKDFRLPLGLKY